MKRRAGRLWVLIGIAFLAFATPALAGGWATVTLDAMPDEPKAGAPLRLGFMVKQHGRTPIDNNPFEGSPLKPLLIATHQETGDKLEVEARKEGPVGHFVVDVTFPTAGTWLLEIVPPPFAGTKFEPLTVLAAAPQSTMQNLATGKDLTEAPAPASVAVQSRTEQVILWTVAGLLLLAALGLTLFRRHGTLGRTTASQIAAPTSQRHL